MKVMNERTVVKDAIRNYMDMYGMDRTYKRGISVCKELSALDAEKATAEEVNKIIGGPWAMQCSCGECEKQSWDIIEIGEPPDYESATAYVCKDCLNKAIKEFN